MSVVHNKSGGKPRKKDYRDFSHSKRFGLASLIDLPLEYDVGLPMFIKDQGTTDLCAAMGSVAVSEDQEGVELSAEWQFQKIKQLTGNWKAYGADPDSAIRALKIGSLEQKDSPFTWQKNGRDFIANPLNWDRALEGKAERHRKVADYRVDGPYDHFNNIRSALYNSRGEKKSVLVGTRWLEGWNYTNGIVPREESTFITWHIYKIRGWKIKNGEPHLIAQLSQGQSFGENGLLYFPKEVINREFSVRGSFARTFGDDDPEEIKKRQWTLTQRIYDLMLTLLGELKTQLALIKTKPVA